jgi:DNA-binding CsgD family transcriptional regulator
LRRPRGDLVALRGSTGELTEAELRVLELGPTQLTLHEIGHRLNISGNTVRTHLRGI